jgi:hypothetical protein
MLESLINDEDEFHLRIGSQTQGDGVLDCNLKAALWKCSKNLEEDGKKSKMKSFKRIWLFTNDDDPMNPFAVKGVYECMHVMLCIYVCHFMYECMSCHVMYVCMSFHIMYVW